MKSILFPFKIEQDNKVAYAKAMGLAKELKAKVIFFTCLPNITSAEKDKAYFHLLDLHGYYQTNYNNWQASPKIVSEKIMETGDFETVFKNFLKGKAIDWIVPTAAIKTQFSAHQGPGQIPTLIKHTRPYYPHLAV